MIKYKEEVKQFCIKTDEMNNQVYNNRMQTDPLRRLKQNHDGKMAELYVSKLLGANDEKHILTIYPKGTFKSDLYYNSNIGISVKSQNKESAEAFGVGRFVFEWSDPILKSKGDSKYIAGVMVEYTLSDKNSKNFTQWCDSITDIKCELVLLTTSEIVRKVGMRPAISKFTRPDGKPSKYILDFRDIDPKDRIIPVAEIK